MIKLTAWETADLLDFFAQYDNNWQTNDDKSMFLRLAEDGTGKCAIRLQHPSDSSSPYRLTAVSAIPMAMNSEDSDAYLHELVVGWTTYGQRMRMTQLLVDELGTDPGIANLMGIALGRITQADDPIPDDPQFQPSFFERQRGLLTSLPVSEKTYYIATGGYVKLELRGGMMATTISVPTGNGGYGHPLRGFVRHPYHNAGEVALHMFGWDDFVQRRMEQIAHDRNSEYETQAPLAGADELPDSVRATGTGVDRSASPEADLPDEPEPAAAVHGLPEEVLLEVRGEPGCGETDPPA